MELHCTLISPDVALSSAGPVRRELVVDAARGTSGADVAAAFARALGANACSVDGVPLERLRVGIPPLLSGAVVVSGAATTGRPAPPPLSLVVHTGPASGTVVPLGRGTMRIGRAPDGPGRSAALADPDLSRAHAEIEVTDAGVVLRDLASANGVWMGGRRRETTEVSTGQEFRLGASTCTLAFSADLPLLDPDAGSGPPAPLRVVRNTPPSRRAAMITMAVLPLVVGVAMALATGMWMFLAFTAVSAISLLIPLAEGRSARRDFERRLRVAADDDAARRRSSAPGLGVVARAGGTAPATGPTAAGPTEVAHAASAVRAAARAAAAAAETAPVHVRLGTARLPANVTIEPADQKIPVPSLEAAPFTAQLQGIVAVHGSVGDVAGLVRSAVFQAAVLPAAAGVHVLVAGGSQESRLASRFLPRVQVLPAEADPDSIGAAVAPGSQAVVMLLAGGDDLESGNLAAYVQAAAERGWPVLGPAEALGEGAQTLIRLHGGSATCTREGASTEFAPDLMPEDAFEAAARHAGSRGSDDEVAVVPDHCGLDELVAIDAGGVSAAWSQTAGTTELRVPLGRADRGPAFLDLVAQGPHVLIAGTTGSGKSELLRSLIAGAAATHAPDRLTFVFIDFKGGSGLEPLAGLPHCVGLVTDLATGGMDRTLTSLRAELKRREQRFREARAADLVDYAARGGRGMPRLVLVVDEFRILVEEAPEAMAELMRIATVGRSLGMHLVMATQRPQGALSADIRANVTTNIALRMQHDAESSDVLGSTVAARIPVGLPGRAYLSIGGGEPLAFQSASLGLASARGARDSVVIVDALDWIENGRLSNASARLLSPADAAAPLIWAAAQAWAERGGSRVGGPLAPPLPEALLWKDTAAGTGLQATEHAEHEEVQLGVVDLPHEQRTGTLTWSPSRDGHLALIGPRSAGTEGVLGAISAQLACSAPARHLYILDADGSLPFLRDHSRVGAHVGIGELRRAARVLARLGEECASRLGQGRDEQSTVPLVLIVSGWGAWVSALRQSPHAWAEETLGGLVRDGAAAGLCVLASGERELVSSRVFGGIPARLYFPLGTTDEARLSWPRLPAMRLLNGRAAAAGTIVDGGPYEAQCYGLPPAGTERTAHRVLEHRSRRSQREARPFRIDPLPASAPADLVAALADALASPSAQDCASEPRRLVVGLAGDEVRPLALRLGSGEVLLVLGAPGTGKSAFLGALPPMNPTVAFSCVDSGSRLAHWERTLARLIGEPGEADAAAENAAPFILVDDADQLSTEENQVLSQLLGAGASVVATAGYSGTLYARCPLALTVRSSGTGILIAPRSPSDGDVFGIRVDVPGRVPPGRAVALVEGSQVDVQLGQAIPAIAQPPESGAVKASPASPAPVPPAQARLDPSGARAAG